MDFDLSEEQSMLKNSVDRLAADLYSFEQRADYLQEPNGWSQTIWAQFAELGLLAMPFAEQDGGFDGGATETMLVMDTFGRKLMLEPYLATIILGGGLLRLGGSQQQREHYIPNIANGSLLLAFAQAESQSRYDLADIATTATAKDGGWVLNGEKRYVLHGDCADKIIVSARIEGEQRDRHGIGLFIVDASKTTRRGYTTQDKLRAADITLTDTFVGNDCVLGDAENPGNALTIIEQVVDEAIAALCAESVGAMSEAHDITVEYLKTRQQFNVTIGSFQALQHRAVDMLVMIEQARSMSLLATMMASETNSEQRQPSICAAKVQIGRSSKYVGQQAIQLHGGIGMTEECSIGHYFRRLSMIELLFGDADHHLTQLANKGGLN